MKPDNFHELFDEKFLDQLLPHSRTNDFFEALYGDSEEGSFDISLKYKGCDTNSLSFEFHLEQRPGRCLVCSLTYGLPQVFSRHPIIDIRGIVKSIGDRLDSRGNINQWTIGRTLEISNSLHVIPLTVFLAT